MNFCRFFLVFIVSTTALAEVGHEGGGGGRAENPEWSFNRCFRLSGHGTVADNVTVKQTVAPGKGFFDAGNFSFELKFSDAVYSSKGYNRETPEIQKNGDRRFHMPTDNTINGKRETLGTTYVERSNGEKTVMFATKEIVRDKQNESRKVRIVKVSSKGDLVEAELTYVKNRAVDFRVLRTCGNAFNFQWGSPPDSHQASLSYSVTPPPVPAGLEDIAYQLPASVPMRRRLQQREARLIHYLFDREVSAQPAR